MKKKLQLNLSMFSSKNKTQPIQVNTWVNTALNARNAPKESSQNTEGRMVELNLTFSKSILGRRK